MKQESLSPQAPETFSAEQVETWLYSHPNFFEQHLELLESLSIPHPSGEAISLVSKQLELLREKNKKLSHQLENLIQIAKENDGLFRRMQLLTVALIETDSAEELVAMLTTTLQDCFLADFVTLRIIADPAENKSGLADLYVSPEDESLEPFTKVLSSAHPECGQPLPAQVALLFSDSHEEVLSSAIIPLQFGELRGLIGIGSREETRFQAGMGNLFLDHIGELVSSRLITLLNR